MEKNTTKILKNILTNFHCEKCDYTCIRKSDFNKHLNSKKHNTTKMQHKILNTCECGKQYSHRASLFNHKKKCKHKSVHMNELTPIRSEKSSDSVIESLLKENLEMKTLMMEMCKQLQCNKITNNTTNNTTNNNMNNTNIFNINMFLNEQCKDAMNMSEFIESIQLNAEDIVSIGEKGQVEGMANILVEKLNSIDILKRPVHCSDVKRETIYVKDEDKWEKEEKEKPKLKNAIEELTKKSMKSMPYLEDDPEKYVKTVSEVLKDPRDDRKIISKIAKKCTCEHLKNRHFRIGYVQTRCRYHGRH